MSDEYRDPEPEPRPNPLEGLMRHIHRMNTTQQKMGAIHNQGADKGGMMLQEVIFDIMQVMNECDDCGPGALAVALHSIVEDGKLYSETTIEECSPVISSMGSENPQQGQIYATYAAGFGYLATRLIPVMLLPVLADGMIAQFGSDPDKQPEPVRELCGALRMNVELLRKFVERHGDLGKVIDDLTAAADRIDGKEEA